VSGVLNKLMSVEQDWSQNTPQSKGRGLSIANILRTGVRGLQMWTSEVSLKNFWFFENYYVSAFRTDKSVVAIIRTFCGHWGRFFAILCVYGRHLTKQYDDDALLRDFVGTLSVWSHYEYNLLWNHGELSNAHVMPYYVCER